MTLPRQRMLKDIQLRGLAARPQQAHLHAVAQAQATFRYRDTRTQQMQRCGLLTQKQVLQEAEPNSE